jgi:hypothetical protein
MNVNNFIVEENTKYRILNVEWFAIENFAVLHLAKQNTITGKIERMYHKITNPEYVCYSWSDYTRVFYHEKEKLVQHRFPFNKRYIELANVINLNPTNLKSSDSMIKRTARKELMASMRGFRWDDEITLQILDNFSRHLKDLDVYDSSIEGKRLYADIETSSDYTILELMKLQRIINTPMEVYQQETKPSVGNDFLLRTNKQAKQGVQAYINSNDKSFNPTLHKLMTTYAISCSEQEYKQIKRKIEFTIFDYECHAGEVNEQTAMSRIDTITYYSPYDEMFYFDFLKKEEFLNEDYIELFKDERQVKKMELVYRNYLRMADFKFDINNIGKDDTKKIKTELGDSFLGEFYADFKKLGVEQNLDTQMIIYQEMLEKFVIDKLDKFSKYPIFELNLKIFNNEMSLIYNYFDVVKNQIKPSYMVFHNSPYDLFYLKLRPTKHNYNPADWFNQYPHEWFTKPLDLEYNFNHDSTSDTAKTNRSVFTCLGLIQCDTLLLNAKRSFGEEKWGLDQTLKREFSEEKFKYAARNIVELYSTTDHFMKYAPVDTLSLKHLDIRLNLIALFQAKIEGHTTWNSYHSASAITTNSKKLLFEHDYGLMLQNNPNPYLMDQGKLIVEKLPGAYVSSVEDGKTYGVHKNVFSVDAASLYPSIMRSNNTFVDKLILRFMEADRFSDLIYNPIRYVEKIGGFTYQEVFNYLLTKKQK